MSSYWHIQWCEFRSGYHLIRPMVWKHELFIQFSLVTLVVQILQTSALKIPNRIAKKEEKETTVILIKHIAPPKPHTIGWAYVGQLKLTLQV